MSCQEKPEMFLSSRNVEFDSFSDAVEISVSSNVDWEVKLQGYADWLTIEPESGSRNGSFTISAKDNPELTTRTAKIAVTGDQVGTDTIHIIQAADFDISGFFNDPIFRKYCTDNFDENGDGILTAREARMVEEIEVINMEITSLRGIEYFTELITLTCPRNWIESLDLSKNTKLRYLRCENNNRLEHLDLSNNVELRTVDLMYNPLERLNVTGLVHLTTLSIFFSDIEVIDLSTNVALRYLIISGNDKLSSLDLSHNRDLTTLQCNDNGFTTLVLDNNTELVSLQCLSNNLRTLDLSKNTKLLDVNASYNYFTNGINLRDNVALTSFTCVKCELTSLDISQNRNLDQLHINENKLTTLDLSNNSMLATIIAPSNNFRGSLDLSKININREVMGQHGPARVNLKYNFLSNSELNSIIVPQGFNLRACMNDEISKPDTAQWCEGGNCVFDPCAATP